MRVLRFKKRLCIPWYEHTAYRVRVRAVCVRVRVRIVRVRVRVRVCVRVREAVGCTVCW